VCTTVRIKPTERWAFFILSKGCGRISTHNRVHTNLLCIFK
jgi:hypothetical protein